MIAPYQAVRPDVDRALARAADPRPRLYAHACMLNANAHQTCQCDRNPLAMKKVLVQPVSTPNRHAASVAAATATGVNKSPNSDNAW
jgi:hypothetical protein